MKDAEVAEVRLVGLLHRLDFPRRWYDLCAASRVGGRPPSHDLPTAEQDAALATIGRSFKYNRREKFYATREAGVPGELGANLVLRHGVAEFILVARVPAGHIGDPFGVLMRNADRRFGLMLPEAPVYPEPWYQGAAELRRVLAEGFGLYAEMAAAVIASGLLTGNATDAKPDAAADGGA
ncbi:MAG: hypothetical protein U0894_00940 [Pirellulales bacterium]